MSYREQLKNLRDRQSWLNKRIRDRETMFGDIISPEARAWNTAHDNIQSQYYEREIAKIEKLAQKELEDELVQNVLTRINRDIKIDTSQFKKDMQKVMKELGFN